MSRRGPDISVGPNPGRLVRLRRWGLESGGLYAVALLVATAFLVTLASALAWWPGLYIDPAAPVLAFLTGEVRARPKLARALAVAVAYLVDLHSGQPLGLWLAGGIAGFGAARVFGAPLPVSRPAVAAALTAAAAAAAALVRAALLSGVGDPSAPFAAVAVQVLATAALGPVAFAGLTAAVRPFTAERPGIE